jgi:hypothetical protein
MAARGHVARPGDIAGRRQVTGRSWIPDGPIWLPDGAGPRRAFGAPANRRTPRSLAVPGTLNLSLGQLALWAHSVSGCCEAGLPR